MIVTNRGLVFHEPASGMTQLLCNEALRVTTAELPQVAITATGALLAASSAGLRQSRDRGCSWLDVPGWEGTGAPALAQDPRDPDRLVVAAYGGATPGLHVTRDGGATWSRALALDSGDYVRSLLVSTATSEVVYATLSTFADGARPAHSLLRTRDGGQSWERLPLPLLESDNAAIAAASSPDDAASLVLYTVASSPGLDDGRLLRSSDGGESFEVVLTQPEIRGASCASDGRLWVAARAGLFGAAPGTSSFEQVSEAAELGCVQEHAGALLVCGHYAGVDAAASGVGVFDAQSGRFERVFDFEGVLSRVSCAADSQTELLCQGPWRDWQAELLTGALPGGANTGGAAGLAPGWPGALPAAASAAPSAPSPPPAAASDIADEPGSHSSCGLAHAPRRSALRYGLPLALFGLALASRLRRR